MSDYIIGPITSADDSEIAKIIRDNLERFHFDIPGTGDNVTIKNNPKLIPGHIYQLWHIQILLI